MGIKGLNKFLRNTCSKNIYQVALWELQGKTIAIDTSIYLYKFNGEESELIDGFYHMISLFKYNEIIPLFVFDGKPPMEKYKTIEQRRCVKKQAEAKYNRIKETGERSNSVELSQLRKKFVKVTNKDILNVKTLLGLMGVSYYECQGESDVICVKLVEQNIAYACMSEDMDMFVYGCNKVLRYLSLLNSTVVVYDLNGILQTLDITIQEFRDICIISGTDYNSTIDNIIHLQKALVLFMKYKQEGSLLGYMEWMHTKGHITNINKVQSITQIFDTNSIDTIPEKITNTYDLLGTKLFLEKHGFVFI